MRENKEKEKAIMQSYFRHYHHEACMNGQAELCMPGGEGEGGGELGGVGADEEMEGKHKGNKGKVRCGGKRDEWETDGENE